MRGKGVIEMKSFRKERPKGQVGGERDDFDMEVEIVTVRIHKSRKDRVVDVVITVLTTVLAVTIAQVVIIPMFG